MKKSSKNVLVSVVKNKTDLAILRKLKFYRLPVIKIPHLKAKYIAFYQPHGIVERGKGGWIKYYGKIRKSEKLPKEVIHSIIRNIKPPLPLCPELDGIPPAGGRQRLGEGNNNIYHHLLLDELKKLPKLLRNKSGMRISFGRTTLRKLKKARSVNELFDITPVEDVFEKALKKAGIKYKREHNIYHNGKLLFRLDFLIKREGRNIGVDFSLPPLDVECDSQKWHSHKKQREKDKKRDGFLRRIGYDIIRFSEQEIIFSIPRCIEVLKKQL